MKRIIKSTVIGALVISMGISTAIASDVSTPGSVGSSDLMVTVAAANFSVTVPMQLPIAVDEEGVVTTATDAKIINNSHGAVKVTNVEITPMPEWDIIDYGADMTKQKVGHKKLGFKINESETNADGILEFNQNNFPKMDGRNEGSSDELILSYDAKLPAQKSEITVGTKVAEVVFTIGWDE